MEQKYIRDSIADDVRIDGRRRTELRDFSVKFNINPQARGSAQVWLGETCVVCFLYSDVTDRDEEAARHGISLSARVIAVSDDVDPASVSTLQTDLGLLYRRAISSSEVSRAAARGVVDRIFSGGAVVDQQPPAQQQAAEAKSSSSTAVQRCGVGVKIVAELSLLSGNGGNLLSAAALAIKSALWCATLPRVHITASASSVGGDNASSTTSPSAPPEASSVEVAEDKRESIAALGVAMPVVVKAVSTDAGFYCADPCLEEEVAASFECVAAVQLSSSTKAAAASSLAGGDDSVATGTSGAGGGAVSGSIVYSRIHGVMMNSAAKDTKNTQQQHQQRKQELSVTDITTLMSESAALSEQLHELWAGKVA